MDTSFIGKPHEWDPRRVYSHTGADCQYRVDFDRLRKDRLQRLREQMTAHKENMYFAIETFAGHPGLEKTCRLEENVLVSAKGPVVFTLMEHMEEAMKR